MFQLNLITEVLSTLFVWLEFFLELITKHSCNAISYPLKNLSLNDLSQLTIPMILDPSLDDPIMIFKE